MTTLGKVGVTTFATPSDHEIEMIRVVEAARHLVWAAYTRPEHVPHWLLGPSGWSMPVCEIDLRPGGAWHYVWRRLDSSEEMEMHGVYREIVPPERLVCTESWGGDWPDTLNTLTLTEQGGQTVIRQRVRYPSQQARDAAVATGMEDGAEETFARLDRYLPTVA